jgi:hypothetical protein
MQNAYSRVVGYTESGRIRQRFRGAVPMARDTGTAKLLPPIPHSRQTDFRSSRMLI